MTTRAARRHNRVAFITGGTRGIGAAVARRLAAEGASVALTHLNRSHDADRIVAELSGAGAEALAIRADVSDPGALLAAWRRPSPNSAGSTSS